MYKHSFIAQIHNPCRFFWASLTVLLTLNGWSGHKLYAQTLEKQYDIFFSNYYLLDIPLTEAGKIIASSNKASLISTANTIFVSKTKESSKYYIFSYVNSIPTPYAKNKFNYVFRRLGEAQLNNTYQNTLIMHVVNSTQEINIGDHVVAFDLINNQLPEEEIVADRNIEGVVTHMETTADFAGTYQSVLINIGEANGLKMGMRVYFQSPQMKVKGYAIPGQYIGKGFVYRLASHNAIALITDAKQEITSESLVSTCLSKNHEQ